jgi:CDP-paratose 2-epimerase
MSDVLITGGAGFIGSNLTHRLLSEGCNLTIYDNLSRPGSTYNVQWLQEMHGTNGFRLVVADLADFEKLKTATEGAHCIYHLAGQVAVTSSVQDPRADFEDNALGTFNVLEAARLVGDDPIFIYASTNKVYGGLEQIKIVEQDGRYIYADFPDGIPESAALNFHSPYGCSKGAGDQYTRDYYRIYGLRSVVMRQSCIYGYRQFGIADQGWIAWFILCAIKNWPITIYGDGKQVRDILFIEDLLNAYLLAVDRIDKAAGQVYNVGGGRGNTLAIWSEFGPILEELSGHSIPVEFKNWRPGDQKVYTSNIGKIKRELGWSPEVSVDEGITRLYKWFKEHPGLFSQL